MMVELTKQGDLVRGEKVHIVARRIDPPFRSTNERSGTHGRMETSARGSVVCVIEQSVAWVYQQKPEEKK
jgi:hypothetical protein